MATKSEVYLNYQKKNGLEMHLFFSYCKGYINFLKLKLSKA